MASWLTASLALLAILASSRSHDGAARHLLKGRPGGDDLDALRAQYRRCDTPELNVNEKAAFRRAIGPELARLEGASGEVGALATQSVTVPVYVHGARPTLRRVFKGRPAAAPGPAPAS